MYVQAQLRAGDSVLMKSEQYALQLYDRQLLKQSFLYNGFEDPGYAQNITGSPYFETGDWRQGSLFYFGRWYRGVPLRYDLVSRNVDIRHYNQVFSMALVKERVDSFIIDQHYFVHLRDTAEGLPNDYYEWLYRGNIQLYVNRRREIEEETNLDGLRRWFGDDKFQMFIRKSDGSWYDAGNRASLLRFMPGRSREIKRSLRKKKIKYRKDPVRYTLEAVRLFDAK